jgi:hypothetical protein
LEEAAAGGYVLFFEHDADNECCVAESTDKGIRVARTMRLDEL